MTCRLKLTVGCDSKLYVSISCCLIIEHITYVFSNLCLCTSGYHNTVTNERVGTLHCGFERVRESSVRC